MSVAGRFAARYYRLQDTEGDDAALLPNRLAVAAAHAIGASGVGLSIFVDGLRLPVGASDDQAVLAERLQFTAGDGPCLQVQDIGRPVRADSSTLSGRWPEYTRILFGRTSFRAVTAIPIQRTNRAAAGPRGCMDVFFDTDDELDDAAAAAAQVVGGIISSLLTVSSTNDGPAWFQGPPTMPRRSTIVALGLVSAVAQLSATESLQVIRAHATRQGRTVDDTAEAVVHRHIPIADLLGDRFAPG